MKPWALRGAVAWAVLAVLCAAVGIVAVKESREPYLRLLIDDLLHPKPAPHTVPLSGGAAVRLYTDTRPHTGKVARLQKGLVLVTDHQERIEEGFGFGLPLVEMEGQAYLSRSASVKWQGNTLVKRYEMDTLDTPSGFLRRKYEPVPLIGTVAVTSTATSAGLHIVADFSDLEVPWDRVYLMNEQGARFFTRYEEPGVAVEGEQFGKWQPRSGPEGCVVAADCSVRYCVKTEANTPGYYGRERYNQYYWLGAYSLSWAGIDLEIDPTTGRFEYQISVERPGCE